MRLVYLIRHASPVIRPEFPTREWTLSERGAREAQVLAGAALDWGIEALFSSSEAKARSTALIIGDAVGLPVNVVDAFDELRIADWVDNADQFNNLVRRVLAGEAPPRGAESAHDAAARFARGLEIVAQARFPAAVVSHGRIIAAYLSRFRPVEDAFELWRSIPMPGWTVIDLDAPAAPPAPFSA